MTEDVGDLLAGGDGRARQPPVIHPNINKRVKYKVSINKGAGGARQLALSGGRSATIIIWGGILDSILGGPK